MKKNKKIIIIGGVAAGASAAAKVRRMSEDVEITLYEKDKYISYATCGLPYYISGKIQNLNELLVSTAESFSHRFNMDVKTLHEVVKIIPAEKTVIVKNLKTGEEFKDSYDKLLIAAGSSAINPDIKGSDAANMFVLKTIDDALKIRKFIENRVNSSVLKINDEEIISYENIDEKFKSAKKIKTNIVITGAGFVGLEMLEAFLDKRFSVVIIEKTNQLLPSFDKEIVDYAENYLNKSGVFVLKEEEISNFEKDNENTIKTVKTISGKIIETDLVLTSIGTRPENAVAKEGGIKIGEKGGIIVDDFMRTSEPDIFAAGDCAECRDVISDIRKIFYLASIASKQGRIAANNIMADISRAGDYPDSYLKKGGISFKKYSGSVGTSIIKILDITVAKAGLSFKEAKRLNFDADKIEVHFLSHAGYYPGAQMMHMILIYDKKDRGILGFEAVGRDGIDKKTDIIAVAIRESLKVNDLAYCDFAYQPEFGAAKDPVNLIGMIGENLFDGEVEFINCEDLKYILDNGNTIDESGVDGVDESNDNKIRDDTRSLSKDDIYILDVRTHREFEEGYIIGAHLIPINTLRDNLDKIDKSKTIIVYCRTGYRAYLGYKILKNNGFKSVKCLNGSYLSWDRKI